MICLKNRTFAVSQTTTRRWKCEKSQLWFAWKIVLLQYRKQLLSLRVNVARGCDLLEKSYFCSIANNKSLRPNCRIVVVICLKNRTFAVSQTTNGWNIVIAPLLWFAWKIVLLQYRKQLISFCAFSKACCDLLEKSYFCSIANNCLLSPCSFGTVVICLKNRTFAVSQTT